jgi:hypothetical protein
MRPLGRSKTRKAHTFKSESSNELTWKAYPFILRPKIQTLEIPEPIVNSFADEIAGIRGSHVLAEASRNLKLSGDR